MYNGAVSYYCDSIVVAEYTRTLHSRHTELYSGLTSPSPPLSTYLPSPSYPPSCPSSLLLKEQKSFGNVISEDQTICR